MTFARVTFALALAACDAKLPHPVYAQHPTSALVEIGFPPPPARPEAVPSIPAGDAVWIDGEWVWRRRRWAWRTGRWVVPPQGATFSPWTMVRRDDGVLFFAPGTWRNGKGEALETPKALATGDVVADPNEIEHARPRTHDAGAGP